MTTTRDEILDIISSTLDLKRSEIRMSTTWEEQSADSMALVELLVALQEHFRIRFQPRELRAIRSVGDMVGAVERKVAAAR